MDTGNTAWLLTASALVLFMTPGLAFFYGGLVRGKNVVNMIMLSFMAMAVVGVAWILWGYSLAFGSGNEIIGNFDFIGFKDVDPEVGPTDGYNSMTVAIFQGMFAIITPALITGAVAERFKFTTYLIFLVLWMTFVYAPIAHWVWADEGWILGIGAADFAGGTVVHINAAMAAVAAAVLVGKRRSSRPPRSTRMRKGCRSRGPPMSSDLPIPSRPICATWHRSWTRPASGAESASGWR